MSDDRPSLKINLKELGRLHAHPIDWKHFSESVYLNWPAISRALRAAKVVSEEGTTGDDWLAILDELDAAMEVIDDQ